MTSMIKRLNISTLGPKIGSIKKNKRLIKNQLVIPNTFSIQDFMINREESTSSQKCGQIGHLATKVH